jgi:hypothetical protein
MSHVLPIHELRARACAAQQVLRQAHWCVGRASDLAGVDAALDEAERLLPGLVEGHGFESAAIRGLRMAGEGARLTLRRALIAGRAPPADLADLVAALPAPIALDLIDRAEVYEALALEMMTLARLLEEQSRRAVA